MTTPIEGPSNEELQSHREGLLQYYEGLDRKKLEKILNNVEFQIERSEQTDVHGTSSLHWQRVVLRDLLGK